MKKKGIFDNPHRSRLELEWKFLARKPQEIEYFINLYENKIKFADNENNLLIPYSIDIVPNFNINKPPKYEYGDFPDIDVDYIEGVREYVKDVYSKKIFGEEYVCNVASYHTFGVKSALKDTARIFGLDHEEVEAVNKKIKDKDSDQRTYTWDECVELFDELRAYCEKYPEVAETAKKIVGRVNNIGQHASGLIVSSVPIRDYIPLVRGKDGSHASAWVEGQFSSDLSTVGFIKFDFLGLDGNSKIATTCKSILEDKRYQKTHKFLEKIVGEKTVCALPGQPSWSDTSYLNDPKSLKMANNGDLRMVFQFDGSQGIRNLAKQGGVASFDDLVAYTALFRPSALRSGLHEKYINRKQGKESYKVHPSLVEGDANLSTTYNLIVYQEQVSRILNSVGKISWDDCEVVRKAISKKKIDKFKKYKDQFIKNGQIVLSETQENLEKLWTELEKWAGYGFNLSHAVAYTYLSSRMLWLKANLPNHFIASMFTHTKASGPKDYNRLKEYKIEAKKLGVNLCGLDINQSKHDFVYNSEIDTVYYGFEKIKGIGEDAAKRLEELQPYSSFEDLLNRFGTESKIIHPIIALNCFKQYDPMTLYKFFLEYKRAVKSEKDRIKRYEKTKEEILKEIEENPEESEKLIKKLEKSTSQKIIKDSLVKMPTLDAFDPNEEITQKTNDEFLKILADKTGQEAELAFYGYQWNHPLERYESYQGFTFEEFLDSENPDGYVEVIINSMQSKKGPKATYYNLQIEDGTGMKKSIIVWSDDYERFKDELQVNNAVRLHVNQPKAPFPNLTLLQYSRYKQIPRNRDFRVITLT